MRKISTYFMALLVGLSFAGCGDDDAPSDADVVQDANAGDAASDDAGDPGDTGAADTGAAEDASAVLGCVDDPTLCTADQMCCSGIPYPTEGICQADCPAVSDRNAKQSFEQVDGDALLDRLAAVPVSEWSYIAQPDVRHMGPMAQDFREAFGLGTSDRTIHPTDANGVTIAALQALYRRVQRLEEENRRLRAASR